MRWFKYCKFLMVCCLIAVFSGCEEDDDYRGYMLSGRWFGDLGMMVDGQPAIGSDLEFIPQDYGGYTQVFHSLLFQRIHRYRHFLMTGKAEAKQSY